MDNTNSILRGKYNHGHSISVKMGDYDSREMLEDTLNDNNVGPISPSSKNKILDTAISNMLLTEAQIQRFPFKSWYRGIIIQQSSAIFGSINSDTEQTWLISTAGVIALISTLLQAIHKALEDGVTAEKHRLALKHYTKMRIGLETLIGDVTHFEKFEDLSDKELYSISAWVNDYQEKVEFIPNISPRLYEKHREEYNRREIEIYNDDSKWTATT
ncbi:hypothetical protein CTEN210_11658 [Chaetoceros tenuissimus]|uniref:Uncharacterized protein n=1 Tax=Chaetoceros tenuissimus TaxID=426638 RepID=A0AAD3CZP6_9STRA|nr:hypothetical protein CTEN210_11658 [Chaetoceros tenuissimus]